MENITIKEISIVAKVQQDGHEGYRLVTVRVSPGCPLGEELAPHIEEEFTQLALEYGWDKIRG